MLSIDFNALDDQCDSDIELKIEFEKSNTGKRDDHNNAVNNTSITTDTHTVSREVSSDSSTILVAEKEKSDSQEGLAPTIIGCSSDETLATTTISSEQSRSSSSVNNESTLHISSAKSKKCCNLPYPRAVIRAVVSLLAGMLAGIAGPGGLLAIVPTMYYDSRGIQTFTKNAINSTCKSSLTVLFLWF